MDTTEFRAGLDTLLELVSNQRVAIMCAETLWWRCHRRLIADAMVVAGFEVVHLGSNGPQSHELTEFARVDERGLIAYDGITP
jgi:uncharacterized protein (DUF488 family)